jgi:hypothetical protein
MNNHTIWARLYMGSFCNVYTCKTFLSGFTQTNYLVKGLFLPVCLALITQITILLFYTLKETSLTTV